MDATDEKQTPREKSSTWLSQIDSARRTPGMQRWEERCKTIRERYRYDNSKKSQTRKYQMLWANMEVLKPAVYSRSPTPVVMRRFRDQDPVGRAATQMLERDCKFQLDLNDFSSRFEAVRDEYLLYGRGVGRVFYEPVTQTVPDDDDEDELDPVAMRGPQGEVAEEKGEAAKAGNPQEVLDFEHVKFRFVHREDFVHEPSRNWDEVSWVAFRAYLGRDDLVD